MGDKQTLELIKYCYPHLNQMWAAKVISIVLQCDFRDAKQECDRFLTRAEL